MYFRVKAKRNKGILGTLVWVVDLLRFVTRYDLRSVLTRI